jgi:hypothetical protein
MSYDPALISFILVGLVGGVAVVMSASSGWEISHELARATDGWTAPLVVRSYPNEAAARERASREASVLEGHGYRAVLRRQQGDEPGPAGAGGTDRAGGPGTPAVTSTDGRIVVIYHLG